MSDVASKQAFKNKEHLTIKGLHKIVAIKASMNKGLSDELKVAFSLGVFLLIGLLLKP